MKNLVIGIDVGGTNIKLGIVTPQGKIVARSGLCTNNYRNKGKLVKALLGSIHELQTKNRLKRKDFSGVGIGLPGLIDSQKGIVTFLPNIPGWHNVPLSQILKKELKLPVFLENDVNQITLAEWKFGAGVGQKNMICMTLGTGIGGGLIIENQLYRGSHFVAGELGHMPLNEKGPSCSCGGVACYERYIGNQTLLKKIRSVFKKNLKIQEVRKLAEKGNKKALKFWKDTAAHLGNGLIGPINLLNPSLVIIGGGVSNNHRFLFKTIRKIIKERCMKVQGSVVRIVRAELGDDAGIMGAQVLVKEMLEK